MNKLKRGNNLIPAAAAISMIFIAASILFAVLRIRSVREENGNELKAVAILRTDQIYQWYNERLSEARFFAANQLVIDFFDNYGKADKINIEKKLDELIEPFLNSWRYDRISLCDMQGRIVYSSSSDTIESVNLSGQEIDHIIEPADTIYADFVFSKTTGRTSFDMINFVRDRSGNFIGAILMQCDPDKYLFPLIQSWPTPSRTSENMLLETVDDSIVFINRLRHLDIGPMQLKMSLKEKHNLVVRAGASISGFFNTKDYRGERVLAYLNTIPGTHWTMVAKVDRKELFAGLYIEAALMLLNILLLSLLTAVLIRMSLQVREKELYRSLLEAEEKQRSLNELQAQKEKENEANYRYMFESNPQPMWIYDIETLQLLEVNRAAVNLYGYTREEFLKLTLKDVRPSEDVPKLLDALSKMDDSIQDAGDWRHLTKSGEIRHVELSSHRVRFKNRDARHIMIKDVTERKLAEQTVRLLGRAVADSTACVVITDKYGNIEYCNPAFNKITGYDSEEIVGANTRILRSGHHTREFYSEMWNTISSGNTWHGEFLNRKKSGELYWESAVISPLRDPDGQINYYVAVKEDITEKKALYESLIMEKERAEEHDKLKTAFLHNISHEIRTPLNAIIGFAGFLDQQDITDSERKEFIDIIFQSSSQLLSILNDILNISQIEAGQVTLRNAEINLCKILNILHLQFQNDAEKKGLEFRMNEEVCRNIPPFINDENKLIQVLTNLISNAIKFTSRGYVEMTIKHKGEYIEFCIADSGIGISAGEQEKIFDRFYQVDHAVSREFGGTGLGLAITKAYVEIMGGHIRLESELGSGTKFYLLLPLNAGEIKEIPTLPKTEIVKSPQIRKILVAEDEESNFMLIFSVLKKRNMKILRARNGNEAVEIFRSEPDIDMVLMDMKMPHKDGFAATAEMKKIRPEIPVIAQTAYAYPGEREKAFEAGCVDYLTKPYGRKELLDLIAKYLR